MLKNKVKILLMSLLLHIELQNFLNAPRIIRESCQKYVYVYELSSAYEL